MDSVTERTEIVRELRIAARPETVWEFPWLEATPPRPGGGLPRHRVRRCEIVRRACRGSASRSPAFGWRSRPQVEGRADPLRSGGATLVFRA